MNPSDRAGREMSIDPVEIRRRNLIPPQDFPYRTQLGDVYDAGEFARSSREGLSG